MPACHVCSLCLIAFHKVANSAGQTGQFWGLPEHTLSQLSVATPSFSVRRVDGQNGPHSTHKER